MALLIFLFTYGAIGAGAVPGLRIDRAAAALLGAIAMVALGVLPVHEAYASIDLGTITLLLGLMLLAGTLAGAGLFDAVVDLVLRRAPGAHAMLAAVVYQWNTRFRHLHAGKFGTNEAATYAVWILNCDLVARDHVARDALAEDYVVTVPRLRQARIDGQPVCLHTESKDRFEPRALSFSFRLTGSR